MIAFYLKSNLKVVLPKLQAIKESTKNFYMHYRDIQPYSSINPPWSTIAQCYFRRHAHTTFQIDKTWHENVL